MILNVSTSLNVLYSNDYSVSAVQQLKRIHNCGFRYIDMNFCDWCLDEASPFRCEKWENWIEELGEYARVNGITFNQAHAPMINNVLSGNELMDELSIRSIRGAGMLGIRWIVFHAGHFPGEYDKTHIEALKKANLTWFDKIVNVAVKSNVGIAIENMFSPWDHEMKKRKRFYCDLLEHQIELVDEFGSSYVGVCWDTGHANVQGYDQAECLRTIGKRLKALHIADNDGYSDQHYAPYYGNILWDKFIRTLYEIGYEGEFTFETAQFIRDRLPDEVRDSAIRLLYNIGEHIVNIKNQIKDVTK